MLEKLFRSKAEVKVLGVVLFTDALHLREIARRAKVSPYEAKRELGIFTKLGILNEERKGNQLFFHINKNCPFLSDLKNLYQKTEGIFIELKNILREPEIKYAFVFGSSARGEEKARSDIDLMIICNAKEEPIAEKIFRVQQKTGKEINFIVWSMDDFKEKISKKSIFLKNISADIIWLGGDEDEFIRLIEKGFGKKNRTR